LVKLAPDLADEQLPDLVGLGGRLAAGFVVSNTTISRPVDVGETQGGLSGAPLRALSTAMIRKVRALTKLPIIGVGGVFTGADAMEKLFAGADLVQLYTSMIYRGPGTPLRVLRELKGLLG
jgi:dihydroorotate dehydrogenase